MCIWTSVRVFRLKSGETEIAMASLYPGISGGSIPASGDTESGAGESNNFSRNLEVGRDSLTYGRAARILGRVTDESTTDRGRYPMPEGRAAAGQPVRTPLRQRSRRRWAVVGGVAASWVVLEVVTGSAVSATVLLVVLAALGAAAVGGLRAAGITRDHPWIRRLASRPWRDGQDVLNVAMRHLPEVFVVTPSGLLLAPNLVQLQLNPGDVGSLCERMELGVISAGLTEVYEDQVAAHGARFAGPERPEVHVVAAGSVPPGRYRLRQGNLASVDADAQPDPPDLADPWYAGMAPEFAYASPQHGYASPQHGYASPQHGYASPGGRGWQGPEPGLTIADGMATAMEERLVYVPVLRLVTGSSVAETVISGARAGRGPVELVLPDVSTVSREHARFTFSDGRWWITNQGRNGLTLNGAPVAGEQPLGDGDTIRWGTRPDALLSRVEIS
jgi:hypothetical protein